MKKYLFIALAALGFAACSEKNEEAAPVQNGEFEQSYVAVTFTADGITRADVSRRVLSAITLATQVVSSRQVLAKTSLA